MEDFRKKHPKNKVESTSKRIYMNTPVTRMWINKLHPLLHPKAEKTPRKNKTKAAQNDNLTGNTEFGGTFPVDPCTLR